jgi:Protein of unknown function with HXXEE motif
MQRIQNLFLLLTIIGPLHMGEQILTSIEEFYAIRSLMPSYYALFDPAAADRATVLLITIVWTICSVLFYAILREGLPRLFVMGFFGLFAVSEVHHVIESLVTRTYDPGVVTCVPYAVVGVLMVRAVWSEFLRLRGTVAGTGLVRVAEGKRALL